MAILHVLAIVLTLLLLPLFLHLLYIAPSTRPAHARRRRPGSPRHMLILLGSGGHTAEMLSLTSRVPVHIRRTYVISRGDTLSVRKAAAFEASRGGGEGEYGLVEVPRARVVGQSWVSTPWSCGACFVACVAAFRARGMPDVVVCNGPGSAVMVVAVCLIHKVWTASWCWRGGSGTLRDELMGGGLFQFLGLGDTRTIYVESFARVKSLSLSGRMLYAFVDRFIVQWPGLVQEYPRAEYHGILI